MGDRGVNLLFFHLFLGGGAFLVSFSILNIRTFWGGGGDPCLIHEGHPIHS